MSKFSLPRCLPPSSCCLARRLRIIPCIPRPAPNLSAADLSARDKALADDAFEGRGPGTKNGEAAAQWIADEMKRIGLKPGNHGSYFQNVPAVAITLDGSGVTLHVRHGAGRDDAEIPRRGNLLDTAIRRSRM